MWKSEEKEERRGEKCVCERSTHEKIAKQICSVLSLRLVVPQASFVFTEKGQFGFLCTKFSAELSFFVLATESKDCSPVQSPCSFCRWSDLSLVDIETVILNSLIYH